MEEGDSAGGHGLKDPNAMDTAHVGKGINLGGGYNNWTPENPPGLTGKGWGDNQMNMMKGKGKGFGKGYGKQSYGKGEGYSKGYGKQQYGKGYGKSYGQPYGGKAEGK